MDGISLKNKFISFFVNNGHKNLPASSLVPIDDSTLLFTNAGMNQFKEIFLGKVKSSCSAAVTCQPCIRAGGKHNDLSNVGFTERHLTSFFMLGNFSFGDYFKEKAIELAWKFLTEELKIKKEILWITVYKDDNEAYEIWKKNGVPAEKIVRLGEKDNFWQMGDTGPCGPCSEIYVDRGIKNEIDRDALPGNENSTRFLEIWNLVFMQYNRSSDGKLYELKEKGIDTGIGLERLCSLMQEKNNVFDIDLFVPIINAVLRSVDAKITPNNIHAVYAIADHVRTVSAILAEGVIPSNDGRGYVIKKILRRAIAFYTLLEGKGTIDRVFKDFLSMPYPLYDNLERHARFIESIVRDEAIKFQESLKLGKRKFEEFLQEIAESGCKSGVFPGCKTFFLYDTFGFPAEMTEVLAKSAGLQIDYDSYDKCMQNQRDSSKKNDCFVDSYDPTFAEHLTFDQKFVGYDSLSIHGTVKKICFDCYPAESLRKEESGILFFDKNPFYYQSGGQISDAGSIIINGHQIPVIGLVKRGLSIGIEIKNTPCEIKEGDTAEQMVDETKRHSVACHHTATHVLHTILSKRYGEHVRQAGSFVSSEKLTFDFTYGRSITREELDSIEREMNSIIAASIPVSFYYTSYDNAIKNGATAFFEDKYDKNNVRVISIDNYSKALCGGTHAKNTNELIIAHIESISKLASNVQRITVLVERAALKKIDLYKKTIRHIMHSFSINDESVIERFDKKLHDIKMLENNNSRLQKLLLNERLALFMRNSVVVKNNNHFGVFFFDEDTVSFMRETAIKIQGKIPGIYLFCKKNDSNIQCIVSIVQNMKELTEKIKKFLEKECELQGKIISDGILIGTMPCNSKNSNENNLLSSLINSI